MIAEMIFRGTDAASVLHQASRRATIRATKWATWAVKQATWAIKPAMSHCNGDHHEEWLYDNHDHHHNDRPKSSRARQFHHRRPDNVIHRRPDILTKVPFPCLYLIKLSPCFSNYFLWVFIMLLQLLFLQLFAMCNIFKILHMFSTSSPTNYVLTHVIQKQPWPRLRSYTFMSHALCYG